MKKIVQVLLIMIISSIFLFSTTYASQTSNSQEVLEGQSTGKLLEMKKHELETIEDYNEKYGSQTYGVTAYILNKVQVFSIPFGLLGIAFSAIYQYVIGIKRMDVRDKGFNSMIAIITIVIICQILPLVFAIVVTSAGK